MGGTERRTKGPTDRWTEFTRLTTGATYLERELVDWINNVEIIDDEVEERRSRGGQSVMLSGFVDLDFRDFRLRHFHLVERWMNGWIDGWMDGWMDGQTD